MNTAQRLPRLTPSFLVALLLIAALIGVAAQAKSVSPTPKSSIEALKLTQTHYFMGKELVTISPSAIRIENVSQLGFILVARAPNWEITVYRPDDKTYFTEDFKTFGETGLMSDLLIGRKDRIIKDRPSRLTKMQLSGFPIMRLTSPWSTLKYMEIDHVTAPQVERILYAAYKMPTNGGIPIGFTSVHENADYFTGLQNRGRLEVSLDTSKIEKMAVQPSFFAPPSGFKKAKSIREVVAGKTARSTSEAAGALWEK